MEARAAQGRSAGGDRYGRERCRALDIAARIVFGVSVMDRQIEEYLAHAGAARGLGHGGHADRVREARQMSLEERCKRIGAHISEVDTAALYGEIRAVRAVRNALAHSTVEIVPGGTVGFGGDGDEYRIEALEEALERVDKCNDRLGRIFGRAARVHGAGRERP